MWYHTLYSDRVTKALNFTDYDVKDQDNLLVCKQTGKGRLFGMVKDYCQLTLCINETPDTERCFYEVILGDRRRKPYFDIDIDLNRHSEVTEIQCDEYIREFIDNIHEYTHGGMHTKGDGLYLS